MKIEKTIKLIPFSEINKLFNFFLIVELLNLKNGMQGYPVETTGLQINIIHFMIIQVSYPLMGVNKKYIVIIY